MQSLTLGQVLVLFEAMGDYVRLTNPWGSEEETAPNDPRLDRPRRDLSADEFGAAEVLLASHREIMYPVVETKNLGDLPADEAAQIRAFLADHPG